MTEAVDRGINYEFINKDNEWMDDLTAFRKNELPGGYRTDGILWAGTTINKDTRDGSRQLFF